MEEEVEEGDVMDRAAIDSSWMEEEVGEEDRGEEAERGREGDSMPMTLGGALDVDTVEAI